MFNDDRTHVTHFIPVKLARSASCLVKPTAKTISSSRVLMMVV